jgi:GNAT superfamily N-acetyltransferase
MRFVVYSGTAEIESVKTELLTAGLYVEGWCAEQVFKGRWTGYRAVKIAVAYNARNKPVAWSMIVDTNYPPVSLWAYTAPRYRHKGLGKSLVAMLGGTKGKCTDRSLPYQEYFWEKCDGLTTVESMV